MSVGIVQTSIPANGLDLETRLADYTKSTDPIYSERINAAKFPTLQAAVDEAQNQNAALLLKPSHTLADPVTLSAKPLRIEGRGIGGTRITPTRAIPAAFQFADDAENNRFDFRDFWIDGQGLIQYGIWSEMIAHSTALRVRVSGATAAGFRFGSGWCNDFLFCEASNNPGDGLSLSVGNANAVNVIGFKSFLNGLGIRITSGFLVNIWGGTIEANRKGGIYAVTGTTLNIRGTYFEANAEDGLPFTTPARTIRADIILNGSGQEANLAHAFPWEAVTIEGCFTSAAHLDAFVWAGGVDGLRLESNGCNPPTPVPLLRVLADTNYAQAPAQLVARNNRRFSKLCAVDDLAQYDVVKLSGWDADAAIPRNYITDDVLRYASLGSAGGGSIRRGSGSYNGSETFEITGATTSDIFGISLDLDDYPELQGRLVTLSGYAKTSATTSGYALYVSSLGASSQSVATTTDWTLTEFAAVLPSTGVVKFGFRKIGATGSSADVATFTRPVLTVAGVPRSAFYRTGEPTRHVASAAPTTGTWAAGDVAWNTSPAASGTIGWVCVTAGAPGTWKTFGSIAA